MRQTTEIRTYTDADYRAMTPGTPADVARTLRAFHSDPKIKAKYLNRVRIHAKADEIIHGTYWENGKGCAVGCTIHSGDHAAYETELGIPRVLANLEDGIFEGMGNGESKTWPERFLNAIKPGADLSLVWPKFAVWLLTDGTHGTIQYARTNSQRTAIQDAADAYQSIVDGSATMVDWLKLRNAAHASAAASAYAYAYAHAHAADASAYASAKTKHRIAQSLKLIELLENA